MAFNIGNCDLSPHSRYANQFGINAPRILDVNDSSVTIASVYAGQQVRYPYFEVADSEILLSVGDLVAVFASDGSALFLITIMNENGNVYARKLYDLA